MSVTYYYETANGLTAGATTTTSGSTVDTNELLVVTSGSTISAPVLTVSAVDLTGSGTAAAAPSGVVYNGGSVTVSGVTETLTGGAAVVTSGGIIVSGYAYGGDGIIVDGGATSGSILSGGFEDVLSGGVTSATLVSGGRQDVYSGGVASGTQLYAGTTQTVHAGGSAVDGVVSGLGTQEILSGATVTATAIDAGGTQNVHAGGQALSNAVIGGGAVYNYGYEAGATLSAGGVDNVMSGGYSVTDILISGGIQVVSAGGATASVIVQAQGVQTIAAGGTATNTELFGGTINVLSGGRLIGLTTSPDPGTLVVSAGGVAYNSIFNGGEAEVLTGGVISGTILTNAQELLMGGTAIGSDIRAGGSEVILSGGTGNGTTLEAGGSVVVYSGGTIENLHINGAGTLALTAGAAVTGDIVLSGSGATLQFAGTSLPAAKIDGLAVGDKIDLFNIAGGTAATYANGALTVTDKNGAVLATIELGTTPSGIFSVGQDSGASGTLITVEANIQTAASAVSSYQAGTLSTQVTVSDSAADVAANLSGLESIAAAGKLAGIALTDSGYATISVTAAQLSADSAALNAISGNLILSVDASSSANATIAGVASHATVIDFSGTASQYTVAAAGDGINVTVTGSAIGTDHISNAEILKFSDFSEILASATPVSGAVLSAANIAELYAAGLGRAPDAAGLNYYENILKATPGLAGATVASWFLASPEYTASHSYAQTTAGDAQFVSDLYSNMLHRAGTTAEITYYQNIISQFTAGQTAGTAAYTAAELAGHSVVLADFSASGEFLANIQITAQHAASGQHWLVLI